MIDKDREGDPSRKRAIISKKWTSYTKKKWWKEIEHV